MRFQEISNSAPEGRRDFCDTAKCAQEPCLYTSYEATYALKRLFFEKIDKNRFLGQYIAKVITRFRKVVETFPIQQNVRNSHVYIQVMKQHMG